MSQARRQPVDDPAKPLKNPHFPAITPVTWDTATCAGVHGIEMSGVLMIALGRTLQRALLTGVALSCLGFAAHAQDAEEMTDGGFAEGEDILAVAISDMVDAACESADSSMNGCRTALAFSADFNTRLSSALAMNENLEMSAYDIGAALREQRDLIVEFDALYRATASLVVRLVNLRADDRLEISQLRELSTRLSRDLELSLESQRLAEERLVLANDEIRYLRELLSDRDLEITQLRAQLSTTTSTNEEELVRLRLALQDSTNQNAILVEQLTVAQLRIADLEAELAEAIRTRDVHIRALAQEQAGRLEAEDALAQANDRIAALTAESEILHKDREALTQTIADQGREIEELRALLSGATSGSDDLSGQLRALIEERDVLLIQLEESMAARDEAQENWRLLIVETGVKKSEIDALNAQIEQLQTDLNDALNAINALNAEVGNLRISNDQLEADNSQLAADSSRYLEDLQLRDAAILILQQNLADAQEQILALRSELDAALNVQADMQAQINDLLAQLSERDANILALSLRLEAATSELGEGSLSLAEVNGQLEEAMAELARLNLEADAARTAFSDLEARCSANAEVTDTTCPVIDDTNALDPDTVIVITGDDLEAQLRAARLELELLKAQPYVRVENVAGWLTDKMVGREDQTAIEFEPRRFSLLQDLLFDTNSAELRSEGEQELQRLALILRELEENPSVRQQILFSGYQTPVDWVLQVAGHADPRPISGGPFADNWELASERALTVVRYLEGLGVPSDRVQSASYGDNKLVNGQEDNDDVNRRISFTVGIR